MAQSCVIKHQERKSHYVEYKEILESTIALNSWIEFQQTCSVFPQESGKLTSIFFCLELQLVLLFAPWLNPGQTVLQEHRWMLKQNLLKRLRRNCFPKAVLDGSLMAVSSGKDRWSSAGPSRMWSRRLCHLQSYRETFWMWWVIATWWHPLRSGS